MVNPVMETYLVVATVIMLVVLDQVTALFS